MRWSPESALVKVNLPVDLPRFETMRWSLSKTSCEDVQVRIVLACVSGERTASKGEGAGAYFDVDEDIQVLVLDVFIQIEIELLSAVLADHKRVLGQPLEEAFRRRALDVEVEALHGDEEGGRGEGERREEGAHCGLAASCARFGLSGRGM
jgi:hypothetical protein